VSILIDANECLGQEKRTDLTQGLNLTYIHSNMLGPNGPVTYLRGRERIDYGLFSAEFLPYIQWCGFEAFQDGPTMDHRLGIYGHQVRGHIRREHHGNITHLGAGIEK
jgi:hypothetical protein